MASVTRSRRKQTRDKRETIETALLDAMQRFGEQGLSYTEVSVEQLAREAGIARSTFYVHFRDKGDLVRRLAGRVTQEIIDACSAWANRAATATKQDLHDNTRAVIDVYLKRRAILSAFIETAAYDPLVAEIYDDMINELISEVRRAHLRVREAGRFHPDATAEIAEIHVYSMERCCQQLASETDPEVIERLAQGLTHMLWNSLYAPEAR